MRDGVLLRLIGKWLKAGVMEYGNISYHDSGSPQGGVISPLLANVFLHYVLDRWFQQEVQSRLRGKVHLIRYADDFVILFTHEEEARRVMEVLPKALSANTALRPHPDKTRLIPFRRPSRKAGHPLAGRGGNNRTTRPKTFDLLGFTHYWGRTYLGGWVVMRQTASNSPEPGGAEYRAMVPVQPASTGPRAALHIESGGARTLRELRNHEQHANVKAIS